MDIGTLYNKARKEALMQIIHEARNHLEKNNHLSEFVMAMGTYFFTEKNGNTSETNCPNVDDIIAEWDSHLYLTGEGIRFSASSEIQTDW